GTGPAPRRGVSGDFTFGGDHPDRSRPRRGPSRRHRVLVPRWRAHPARGRPLRDPARDETPGTGGHGLGPARPRHGGLGGHGVSRGALAHPVDTDPQLLAVRLVSHRPRPGHAHPRDLTPARFADVPGPLPICSTLEGDPAWPCMTWWW